MKAEELQYILKKYNLTPNKLRGQNFLICDDVLEEIVKAAKVSSKDLVLEVGPGVGSLTTELLKKVGKLVAFEIEKSFSKILNSIEKVNPEKFEVIWQDILSLTDQQWTKILRDNKVKNYKIVANIPYYLTGKLIQKSIMAKNKPTSMTLMIQKEVAQRIVSDDEKASLLSLSVDFYAKSKIINTVDKSCFYPIPKVDSAVIHIFDIKDWSYEVNELELWKLIHRGFAKKRKKLVNNLQSDPRLQKDHILKAFDKIGIDKNIRAERLSPQNWIDLGKELI